jgi:RNA polymerase sigma-70 factor (ECF subfamily)
MDPDRVDDRPETAMTFEQLFADYRSLVYGVCLKFTGTPEDAEDAAQEVFTKIWKKLEDFQDQSSLKTWVYRIAINTCIDHSRRPWRRLTRRRAALDELESQGEEESLLSGERSAEERLLAEEQASQVRRAVARLKPHLRAVLILKDLEGLSYEEISAVLGINLGTISSRLNRARKALQDHLRASGTVPSSGS